jgi:hypothetical protein
MSAFVPMLAVVSIGDTDFTIGVVVSAAVPELKFRTSPTLEIGVPKEFSTPAKYNWNPWLAPRGLVGWN